MKKKKEIKRVDSKTRINGEISLAMQKKSSPFSVSVDRKKKQNKYKCRTKTE